MINIPGQEFIEGYSPDQVWGAGIVVENLPSDMEGFSLSPQEKRAKKLRLGSVVNVSFSLSELLGDDKAIKTAVTTFESGELIVIEGDSEDAWAQIQLELSESEDGGTKIDRNLAVDLHSSFLTKKPKELILKEILRSRLDEFNEIYIANIEQHLGKLATVTSIGLPTKSISLPLKTATA